MPPTQQKDINYALLQAAQWGDFSTLLTALQQGAQTSAVDQAGRTALHLAAGTGRLDFVQHLLPLSDPHQVSLTGCTPLHYAAWFGYADCVQFLIPHSDLCSIDAEGKTPLHYSAFFGHSDCIRLLLPVSDLAQVGPSGATAFHFAVRNGQSACVKDLLSLCPALAQTPNSRGSTPLHWAAQFGQTKSLALLLPYSDPSICNLASR